MNGCSEVGVSDQPLPDDDELDETFGAGRTLGSLSSATDIVRAVGRGAMFKSVRRDLLRALACAPGAHWPRTAQEDEVPRQLEGCQKCGTDDSIDDIVW